MGAADSINESVGSKTRPRQVFLSYRRSDTQMAAGRLREALAQRFGAAAIFRDKDSIAGGEDWTKAIDESLGANAVVLALIGPDWVNATNDAGARRLDDPADWNRVELEQALRGKRTLIPVLVDDARMPAADELPETLRPLTRMNAVKLRDDDWAADIERLARVLVQQGLAENAAVSHGRSASATRRIITIGIAAGTVAAVAGGVWFYQSAPQSARSVSGSWIMTHFNEDNSKHVGTLTLEQRGDRVTGSVEWARKGGEREISNGFARASVVEFEAVGPRGARRVYRGELDSGGNAIQGRAKGGSATQATWSAVRQNSSGTDQLRIQSGEKR